MKKISIALILALLLIGGAVVFSQKEKSNSVVTAEPLHNVSIVDGKQIIEITAKGGYLPEKSIAKAGIPTILRFDTSGTFDCSASVRIPSMDISKTLPQSGITDIDIGTQVAGIFKGTCGMGMYPFEVEFQG